MDGSEVSLNKESEKSNDILEANGGISMDLDNDNKEISLNDKKNIDEAIYYACMQISDEVMDDKSIQNDDKIQFCGTVIAQVASLVSEALCDTWPNELIALAKHGRRSVVNASDVMLLMRRNQSLVSYLEAAPELSAKRQKSGPVRRRSKAAEIEHIKVESMDGTPLKVAGSKANEGRSRKVQCIKNADNNVTKITDFLSRPSTSDRVSPTPSAASHLSDFKEDSLSSPVFVGFFKGMKPEEPQTPKRTVTPVMAASTPLKSGGSSRDMFATSSPVSVMKSPLPPDMELEANRGAEQIPKDVGRKKRFSEFCFESDEDSLDDDNVVCAAANKNQRFPLATPEASTSRDQLVSAVAVVEALNESKNSLLPVKEKVDVDHLETHTGHEVSELQTIKSSLSDSLDDFDLDASIFDP